MAYSELCPIASTRPVPGSTIAPAEARLYLLPGGTYSAVVSAIRSAIAGSSVVSTVRPPVVSSVSRSSLVAPSDSFCSSHSVT